MLEFTPTRNRDRHSSKPEIRSGLLNFRSNQFCTVRVTTSPPLHLPTTVRVWMMMNADSCFRNLHLMVLQSPSTAHQPTEDLQVRCIQFPLMSIPHSMPCLCQARNLWSPKTIETVRHGNARHRGGNDLVFTPFRILDCGFLDVDDVSKSMLMSTDEWESFLHPLKIFTTVA